MIQEDDKNMYHTHPYSIAKIIGHSMVDFYRKTYGLPFSNGIIFTTESSKKKPVFLLNKVAKHIKSWLANIKEPLCLGPLHSSRNILHAFDVASAIKKIVAQEHGENYLICNEESFIIHDLVIALYRKAGIILETRNDNTLYDQDGNCVVQIMKNDELNIDDQPIHIRGVPSKLLSLHWKPTILIDQILDELLNI
jgi:GDP-D-mannose dehydratase